MKNNIVVTNLRIPKNVWLQAKSFASELGMSMNQYLNWILHKDMTRAHFEKDEGAKKAKRKTKSKKSIYDALSELAETKFTHKPMGASEEDKIIYG